MFEFTVKNKNYAVKKRIILGVICFCLTFSMLAFGVQAQRMDSDLVDQVNKEITQNQQAIENGLLIENSSLIENSIDLNLSPENLIRFHVIANSDSNEDQAMKYAVRDAILKEVAPKLAQSRSIDESRAIILNMESELVNIATSVVQEWNRNYGVSFDYGRHTFPSKSYGSIVFPSGEYEAVKIKIGQASGANWWCVLFPPLCFVNVEESTAGVPIDTVNNPNNADTVLDNSEHADDSSPNNRSTDSSGKNSATNTQKGLSYKGKKVGFYLERFLR